MTSASPPLPKRPKGKLFIGSIILSVVVLSVYSVWNSFLRFQAYGVVQGRVLQVSAPWNGTVRALHCRDGEDVRQRQVLVTMESLEIQQRLARASDELLIAQASLDAEVSQMRWNAMQRDDQHQKALAEMFELWGNVQREQAKLHEFTLDLKRADHLQSNGAVSQESYDAAHFDVVGQRGKVEKMQMALQQMRRRVETHRQQDDDSVGQLKPHVARIEMLQSEIQRLRSLIEEGHIRSPVDGRVLQRLRFAGEFAGAAEAVIEILEEGSLEIVLYIPQRRSHHFSVGDRLKIEVESCPGRVVGSVVRLGDLLVPAPPGIARYYNRGEKLVTVHVKPDEITGTTDSLRLGSTAKLPAVDVRAEASLAQSILSGQR
jgi:multidrug resistance efflux pump